MNYYFQRCSFDYELVRKSSQCDRITCQGNHNPQFNVYFHKVNNKFCYCLNQKQLSQYWFCVVQDREKLCPMSCSRCKTCKEFTYIFSELTDAYFFTPRKTIDDTEIPFQPVLWRVFSANEIYIQIAKSKKNTGIITNYGEVCWSKFCFIFGWFLLWRKKKPLFLL